MHLTLLTGCGETTNKKNADSGENNLQTTTLSYELSGLTKTEDGSYKGEKGSTVTIKAKAEGPKAEEAKWTKLKMKTSKGAVTNMALLNSPVMTIDQIWEVKFEETTTVELTFGLAENITINGVPVFSGQETFKIVIE